ncbi:MAG TPA: DNA-binding domain-containing protein [Methylomirabilota bacterium]|jgi:hypothetical protein|nr:DNA-binding domain-containing protein [Methylomirabilota bacterium]
MRPLRELQADFASTILGEDVGSVASLIVADGLPPAARVQVYRNHVLSSLTETLETTYPVVCRLVDRQFFGFAVDRFIRSQPPTGPCLFEYGAALADFLAGFPPCAGHPYLPDIARLEWAMNAALHAEDVPAIAPSVLAVVPPEDVGRLVLRLDPSAAWLRSSWPIDRIWQVNQAGADPDAQVDLAAGEARLEIRRQDDRVAFRRLEAAEFAFRAGLGRGLRLEVAADAALAEDQSFDLTAALRALLDEALLVGFTLVPESVREGESR